MVEALHWRCCGGCAPTAGAAGSTQGRRGAGRGRARGIGGGLARAASVRLPLPIGDRAAGWPAGSQSASGRRAGWPDSEPLAAVLSTALIAAGAPSNLPAAATLA